MTWMWPMHGLRYCCAAVGGSLAFVSALEALEMNGQGLAATLEGGSPFLCVMLAINLGMSYSGLLCSHSSAPVTDDSWAISSPSQAPTLS